MLHYVIRTRESVILDDASAQNPFSADTYIRQRHARSILCLPLINQAKLIGLLYLENNLTPHVFTPTRISVLKLLASQAAISLENTRLYGDLQEREAKIRRLVEANIIGIVSWKVYGSDHGGQRSLSPHGGVRPRRSRVRWRELERGNAGQMARGRRTGVGRACRHRASANLSRRNTSAKTAVACRSWSGPRC